MTRTRHLLRSSVLVILFFGIVKITGLIRLRLISTAFGTGPEYDAFTAANQLPEVFFILIAGGNGITRSLRCSQERSLELLTRVSHRGRSSKEGVNA